jgi:hypothetical protein
MPNLKFVLNPLDAADGFVEGFAEHRSDFVPFSRALTHSPEDIGY